MHMQFISQFPHRKNLDGSYDSICRLCFKTVGTHKFEQQLTQQEKSHICDKSFLHYMRLCASEDRTRRP